MQSDLILDADVQVDEPGGAGLALALERLGQAGGETEVAGGGGDGQRRDVAVPGQIGRVRVRVWVVWGYRGREGGGFEFAEHFLKTKKKRRRGILIYIFFKRKRREKRKDRFNWDYSGFFFIWN